MALGLLSASASTRSGKPTVRWPVSSGSVMAVRRPWPALNVERVLSDYAHAKHWWSNTDVDNISS